MLADDKRERSNEVGTPAWREKGRGSTPRLGGRRLDRQISTPGGRKGKRGDVSEHDWSKRHLKQGKRRGVAW